MVSSRQKGSGSDCWRQEWFGHDTKPQGSGLTLSWGGVTLLMFIEVAVYIFVWRLLLIFIRFVLSFCCWFWLDTICLVVLLFGPWYWHSMSCWVGNTQCVMLNSHCIKSKKCPSYTELRISFIKRGTPNASSIKKAKLWLWYRYTCS